MRPWGVLATASIWLVLSLSLWATGSRPAVIVLAGIVIVGAALVVSVVDVARDIGDTGWSRPRITNRPINDDQRVTQLRHQMAGARQTDSSELHDRLVSLADDRLIVHHGIHRSEQPLLANRALTPTLRALLNRSPRRLGSRRTLDQTITDIEAL